MADYRDPRSRPDQCPDAIVWRRSLSETSPVLSASAWPTTWSACRRCTEHVQILARTDAETRRAPGAARRAWWVAAAAVAQCARAGVLISACLSAVRSRSRNESRNRRRGRAEDREPPRLSPREFAWTPPAGASSHRLRLFDASGKRVWSDALSESRAPLPDSVAGALSDGSYFWTVEVETAAGAEKLGPFPFDLARR